MIVLGRCLVCLIVGAGAGNSAMVIDVFSFVGLLVVIDPPLAGGKHVLQEPGSWELLSFCEDSGVEVYVRLGLVGLFEVVTHGVAGVSVGFYVKGTLNVLRSVYMKPELSKDVWVTETSGWGCLNLVFGDMNSRDLSWDVASNTCGQ